MGCHFCGDELYAIFAILMGWRFIPMWVRGIWARRHRNCSNPNHKHGGES